MMKKFGKLNLDDELPPDAFEDHVIGPCKPGCNFFKFLGRGPPLHVPIPETIFIGSGNFIKFLYNEPAKGVITQEIKHFDQQEVRDEFITNCVNKFVRSSVPVSSPPEPIYARFVAVQKKPAVKSNRAYNNTQCDFLLPIAFQSQLLEITDNNLPPCVIQRFIKSRGRRPGVYRLFWKRAGNEVGAAEGWNITKKAEEFKAPDLITLEPSTGGNAKPNEDQNAEELDEITFKRQTTKFIASYIRAGEVESQEDYDPLDAQIDKLTREADKLSKSIRPFSAPLAKRSMRASIRASMQSAVSNREDSDKDRTFLTSAMGGGVTGQTERSPSPKLTRGNTLRKSMGVEKPALNRQETAYTAFTEQRPDEEGDGAGGYEKKAGRRHSVDYFSSHSVEEVDELFLKGMLSKMYINPADRTRALLISAKANADVGTNTSASISNNDGELSADKCSRLTATRVSSAALELPISYLSQISHWIQVMLRDMHHLQVFVSEIVGDFIKDDDDKWWFINLKSFRLTEDSLSKVQMWHAIYVKKDAAAVQQYKRSLSNKERIAKNETERGSYCNTCGLHYMPHQTTQSADGLQVIPVFGYNVTFSIARQIAKLLNARGVPGTHLTRALMKITEQGDINLRSVKQLLYGDSHGSKSVMYKDHDAEKVKCCYQCYNIYQEMVKVEEKLKELHILLGVDAKKSAQKEKEGELLVTHTKSPYDMSLVNTLPPSPFDTVDHTNVSMFQSTAQSTISHRPSSAPATMKRRTYMNTSLMNTSMAGKMSEEHKTEDERQLQVLVNAIKEKHSSIPTGLKYSTYHSIPIGVQHYRVLCMFHYVVLEEPDRVNNMLLHAQSLEKELPKHYVVQYRFGQQQVFIPFVFDPNNQLKSWFDLQKRSDYSPRTLQRKKTKLLTELTTKTKSDSNMFSKTKSTPKQNMIFIQESRLHTLVSKGQDLGEYFRDNQIPCKLYSLLQSQDSSKPVDATPSKARTTFMTSHGKDSLPRQSADSLPSTLPNNKPKIMQDEGEFNMYMHKLNVQGGSLGAQNNNSMSSLVEGTEKQDLLITVPTKSLGTLSFKISIAIVRDEKLPSNLSSVDRYLVDKHSVYYPPKDYVPDSLTLPPSWLSMLLSPINTNAEQQPLRSQDRRRSTRYSSPSRRETLWSGSGDQQTGNNSTDDEEDSTSSESSVDINDGQDDLIERMLDKEIQREQRAKEQLRLEKMQAERDGVYKKEMEQEKLEEEKHSHQKFIANAQDNKPWKLLTQTLNAVSATQKLMKAGAARSEEKSGPTSPPPPQVALIPPRKTIVQFNTGAGAAERSRHPTFVSPVSPIPSVAEEGHEDVGGVDGKTEGGVKAARPSRVMSSLAAALRERAKVSSSPQLHDATTPTSTSSGNNAAPAPVQASSTASSTPTPASTSVTGTARRGRSYSLINNDILKFTALHNNSSYSLSGALKTHFYGVETLCRVMEDYVGMTGDDGEVESKGVLVGLSTLLHTIQDVYTLFIQNKDKSAAATATGKNMDEATASDGEDESNAPADQAANPSSASPSPAPSSATPVSFFTIARVMSKHSSVRRLSASLLSKRDAVKEEGGHEDSEGEEGSAGGGSAVLGAENSVSEGSSAPPPSRNTSIYVSNKGASGGPKTASIKDLLLMRAASHQHTYPPNSPQALLLHNIHNPNYSISLVPDSGGGGDEDNTPSILVSELLFLSPELLEGSILTIRQLTLMDYLPPHITWAGLKPLILETLPMFLTEK